MVLEQTQLIGPNNMEKKEREGQTLVTLKKNVEQGVFLLIDSFVVSVSYKTRKGVL